MLKSQVVMVHELDLRLRRNLEQKGVEELLLTGFAATRLAVNLL
jgi:hypothetical protein